MKDDHWTNPLEFLEPFCWYQPFDTSSPGCEKHWISHAWALVEHRAAWSLACYQRSSTQQQLYQIAKSMQNLLSVRTLDDGASHELLMTPEDTANIADAAAKKYELRTFCLLAVACMLIICGSTRRLMWILLTRSNCREQPAVLLILGGNKAREIAAARLMGSSSTLKHVRLVLLSSGAASAREIGRTVRASGWKDRDGHPGCAAIVDNSAIDTLSNFTSLAEALCANAVARVAISTSRQHARRALLVGTIVLGASGIRCVIEPVDSPDEPSESLLRCARDGLRALAWLTTGADGSLVARIMHPRRALDARSWRAKRSVPPLGELIARAQRHERPCVDCDGIDVGECCFTCMVTCSCTCGVR